MNIAYEMLIIVTLIVATLFVVQGREKGTIEQPHIVRVSLTHS